MTKEFIIIVLVGVAGPIFAQQEKHITEVITQINEAKEKKQTELADSIAINYIDNHLFKLEKRDLMSKNSLLFISENLGNTSGKAFTFFVKNRNKVNNVLGKNKAEYAIRNAITKYNIPTQEELEKVAPDWDELENNLSRKFGILGLEALYGKRMMFYLHDKNWVGYNKYYKLYLEKAYKRPEWNINFLTYSLFLNSDDKETLTFATDVVMKYAIKEWYENNVHALDTYANLLYKIGRIREAIKWQEVALKKANGTINEKNIARILGMMERGERTW